MKRYLIHFFASLLITNCLVFGASLAGAEPTYWTFILTVCFSFVFATVMQFEPRIKL